jgi:VIT1/CCC1 family predicted Fe2+/Mn2+ transporter
LNKEKLRAKILVFQKSEITEHIIYKKLSRVVKDKKNKKILNQISADELRHYKFWESYSKKEIKPDKLKIWFYYVLARLFGLTFAVKLMEKGETDAAEVYEAMANDMPDVKSVMQDELNHEKELLNLIDEERLKYVGSVVLGLNDALVELTGALAGLTLALREIKLVAVAGLVTGIAASLSMAASEYLSTKSDGDKDPIKASIYTGIAYFFTVLFLIFPYLIFSNPYFCLGIALFNAIIVIFIFTFYVSVAQEVNLLKRFTEMAAISLGVAALSFVIGFFIRNFFGIDV